MPKAYSVILARGCRAKNPSLSRPPRRRIRDSSRAPDTRPGMTSRTAPVQKPCHYIMQDSIGWSLAYMSATTILADVTPPLERAVLIGVMDFSVAIGGATASFLGGERYGLAGLGGACVPRDGLDDATLSGGPALTRKQGGHI
jgi:hypothetical protein